VAFEEFGDEKGSTARFADVVNGENVRVIERCDRARFLLETPQAFGVAGKRFGQNFEGYFAAETRVAGAINFAHSAGADGRDDFVGANLAANGEGH
jgi:hypothetical protein